MAIALDDRILHLADLLVDNGVNHAFGITGSGPSWQLITELEDRGVRYTSATHEAAAALMAGGVSRVTGAFSVAVSIKGPGAANLFPGMLSNGYEGLPVIGITEAYSPNAAPARMHKKLDQRTVYSTFIKAHGSLAASDGEIHRILDLAKEEFPGPVIVDLADGPIVLPDRPPESRAIDLETLLSAVANARKPVLIAGSYALRRPWRSRLDALRIPVFTTAAGKGLVNERHPHCAGVFTGTGREIAPESRILPSADLVVGIGLRHGEVIAPAPFTSEIWSLDALGPEVSSGFSPKAHLRTDDARVYEKVIEALSAKDWGGGEVSEAIGGMRDELLRAGWLPARAFAVIDEMDFDHALALDTGSFCTIGEHLWNAFPGRVFLGSSNGRFMGTGIPTAVGAAIALNTTPVFCALGDGGMHMYPAEIRRAVHDRLPLCVILMTDARYGSIACAVPDRSLSARAVDIPEPSWFRIAEAMGCLSILAGSEDAFVRAVHEWDRKSPLFIEVPFPPDAYAAMTARLRA